ncbi:MAG: transporter substrate-binding domain-containing protein [Gemmatimonadota bacterium]|nr:transporter substrate-binding domain-containing protein [Gemmatimonadota bacterium]
MIRQCLSRLLSISVVFITTVSCGSSSETSRLSLLDQIKQRGTLRVGLSTFVPWAMRDKQGELIGFEVDVSKKLAKDAGLKVDFVPTAWDGIIPGLLAGKFDVIIGGLTITPQRNLSVSFTRPYSHSGVTMAGSKQLMGNASNIEEYNKEGVTITVRRGSTAVKVGQDKFPNVELRQFDDDAQAFQEVLNGNAHGVISTSPKPEYETIRNSDKLYIPFERYLYRGSEAIAIRHGEVDALNFMNNWIYLRTEDGWLEDRHEYWFNSLDWQDRVADSQ